MTLIPMNVEQLRREGTKNSKQFKEQKNFYDTDQAMTEFEDMLQCVKCRTLIIVMCAVSFEESLAGKRGAFQE